MTAKKKPARVPRTTVTGWGVLLLPLFNNDKPMFLTQGWHDEISLPVGLESGSPLRFSTKQAAIDWWRSHRLKTAWRLTLKARIVRITGTYKEAK